MYQDNKTPAYIFATVAIVAIVLSDPTDLQVIALIVLFLSCVSLAFMAGAAYSNFQREKVKLRPQRLAFRNFLIFEILLLTIVALTFCVVDNGFLNPPATSTKPIIDEFMTWNDGASFAKIFDAHETWFAGLMTAQIAVLAVLQPLQTNANRIAAKRYFAVSEWLEHFASIAETYSTEIIKSVLTLPRNPTVSPLPKISDLMETYQKLIPEDIITYIDNCTKHIQSFTGKQADFDAEVALEDIDKAIDQIRPEAKSLRERAEELEIH